jgi:uncharacterized membrane protein
VPSEDKSEAALGLERMLFFSDAVYAIVITLLVLELRLPNISGSDRDLRAALIALAPKYVGYVVSFSVVGIFWLGHHRKFRTVKRYDAALLRFNLLHLMVIAFIPFASSVVSANWQTTGVVFYSAVMLGVSLSSALVSWYALRWRALGEPDAQSLREPLLVSGVFALSIALAWWSRTAALCAWVLVIPATTRFRRSKR